MGNQGPPKRPLINFLSTQIFNNVPVQFFVIELTSSNLIIDIPRGIISFGSGDWGELVATYKGRKIYRSESDIIDEYWYTSGSKMVYCEPINEENYEDGWMDTMRIYLKK